MIRDIIGRKALYTAGGKTSEVTIKNVTFGYYLWLEIEEDGIGIDHAIPVEYSRLPALGTYGTTTCDIQGVERTLCFLEAKE